MSSLGSLVVSLAVDTAKFEGDLGRAAALAEARMARIKDTSTKALAAITIAAASAGTALYEAFKDGTERAEELNRLSQVVGVTVENLSRLQFAASKVGVSNDDLTVGIRKLSVNVAAAAAGSGAASAKFEAMGISVKDANGHVKDADTLLKEIAAKFETYADGVNKTALATAIFGKAGANLIPLLNEGAKGMDEAAATADRLGLTMSTSAAQAAEHFKQRMDELHAVTKGLANVLTAEALPTLNSIVVALTDAATKGDAFKETADQIVTLFKVMSTAGLVLVKDFEFIGKGIAANAASSVALLHGHFAEAQAINKAFIADAESMVKEFRATYNAIWNPDDSLSDVEVIAKKMAAPLVEVDKKLKEFDTAWLKEADRLNDRWKTLTFGQIDPQKLEDSRADYSGFMSAIQEDSDHTFKAVSKIVDDAFYGLGDAAQAFDDSMKKTFDDFLKTGQFSVRTLALDIISELSRKEIFTAIDKISHAIDDALDKQARSSSGGIWGSFLNAIGGLFSGTPDFSGVAGQTNSLINSGAGLGGQTAAFALDGQLASGGPVKAGLTYLVGERGPELFRANGAGSIIPNDKLGGGGDVHVYVTNYVGATGEALVTSGDLQANNQQLVRTIQDQVRRGGFERT